jgi:hypothetical protein
VAMTFFTQLVEHVLLVMAVALVATIDLLRR